MMKATVELLPALPYQLLVMVCTLYNEHVFFMACVLQISAKPDYAWSQLKGREEN